MGSSKAKRSSSAVREPAEAILAIDHKSYPLSPDTCVIADTRDPVAIRRSDGRGHDGNQLAHHRSARRSPPSSPRSRSAPRPAQLNLHSDSSFRFERRVRQRRRGLGQPALLRADPRVGRRRVGPRRDRRRRASPRARTDRPAILAAQANPRDRRQSPSGSAKSSPPWATSRPPPTPRPSRSFRPAGAATCRARSTLSKEVARIHGYDKIPEDVRVPMSSSVLTLARIASSAKSARCS